MTSPNDWLQLALFAGALLALTRPLGCYLTQVFDPQGRTFLDPVCRPLERLTYRLAGIDPAHEQSWRSYATSLLAFSAVGLLFTYALLRCQHLLPLNPRQLPGLAPALAFNTAVSFTTNTNWQSYGGEGTMSYFSQAVGLTLHNFTSAAAGLGVAAAFVRGLARQGAATVGSFWTDLVRVTCYLLLPLSLAFAVFLVSQGMIQNFKPYDTVRTLEESPTPALRTDPADRTPAGPDRQPAPAEAAVGTQTIAQGPMASQVAIKILGANGGGFTNANASHPFENPTPLANFLQMLAIFALPSALTHHLGRAVGNPRHGWAVWSAMFVLFLAGALVIWWAEAAGNPLHHALGVAAADGNLEGKELRFGVFNSALFAAITTAASCGAVNAMHDSFTPLGGLVTLFNIQSGEVIFGGVGAGLYGMLTYVILAVFIAGLMVGRTPEYLGKKIGARDVKLVMLVLMLLPAAILGLTAWAATSTWGVAGLNNAGPHGFSEMLYAYSSAVGNNGSAFAGLTTTPADGDVRYNVTLAAGMLVGRFLVIVPILALAGGLAARKHVPAGPGTFRTEGATFVVLLVGTVVLVGALTFLPALAMGPVVEHALMHAGGRF